MKLSKIKSNRTYGIEIEFYSDMTRSAIASKIRETGINISAESYNHNTRDYWKLITDASCGYEVVSPVLRGQNGIVEMEKILKVLNDLGCTVDRACGVHVHVGIARDPNRNKGIINLLKYMHANRKIIDAMMPESRRENNNRYCKNNFRDANGVRNGGRLCGQKINRKLNKLFNTHSNTEVLVSSIQTLIGRCRYKKINLNCFRKYGTVEFRQHAGSLDAAKIGNWVVFCTSTVDKCFKAKQMSAISTSNVEDSIINCFGPGYNRKMFNFFCWRLIHFGVIPMQEVHNAKEKALRMRRV